MIAFFDGLIRCPKCNSAEFKTETRINLETAENRNFDKTYRIVDKETYIVCANCGHVLDKSVKGRYSIGIENQ